MVGRIKHESGNKRECMLDIPVTQFRQCKCLLVVCFVWLAGKVHSSGLVLLATGSSCISYYSDYSIV